MSPSPSPPATPAATAIAPAPAREPTSLLGRIAEVVDFHRADGSAATETVPRIELLDAGAAPREALRYHAGSGSRPLTFQLAGTVADPSSANVPAHQAATLAARSTQKVDVDGHIVVSLTFDKVTLEGDERAAEFFNLADTKELRGAEVDLRISSRGALVSVVADPGLLDVARSLGSSFRGVAVAAFPEEPVGIGARWRTHHLCSLGRHQCLETNTYTLVRRDAGGLRLEVTNEKELLVDQHGPLAANGVAAERVESAALELLDRPQARRTPTMAGATLFDLPSTTLFSGSSTFTEVIETVVRSTGADGTAHRTNIKLSNTITVGSSASASPAAASP